MVFEAKEDYIYTYRMKEIISGVLNKKDYNEVKEYINDMGIKLTEEEITYYLEERLKIEKPDLLERVNNRKNGNKTTKQKAEEFIDDIEISAYSFSPFVFEYYSNYMDILKKKVSKMLNIIDQIDDVNNKEVFKVLEDLDITINSERKIKREDAERLLQTILYNLSDLLRKVVESNNPETYYSFRHTKESIYRDGLIESDLYPSEELQVKNLYECDDNQYIPLTDKQIKEIKKKEIKKYKFIVSLIN